MITTIALSAFLLVIATLYLVFSLMEQRSARADLLRSRLAALQSAQARNPSSELELLRDELLSEIPALNKLLTRSRHIVALSMLLSQAAVKMRPGKFLLVSAAASVVAGLAAHLLQIGSLLVLVALFLGAVAPLMYVRWLRAKRFKKFEQQFPDAIDLLARAVRAGHAYSTALEMIGAEAPEPVAGEFRQVFDEQRFGLPIRDALLNFADRVPIMDVKFFVTTVLLQRETGGNLAEILDKLSYVIRERFKILRQVRVFTAQGRLSFIILMLLAPSVGLLSMLGNPEFIRPMFTDPLGQAMVTGAVLLQLTGFFIIRRIIDIKV
ncbi:MAG TPA: type II secretion system F family protein [Clostridia bacterium]|nr:type II secretion system F family protein [Clostridia bacterium]